MEYSIHCLIEIAGPPQGFNQAQRPPMNYQPGRFEPPQSLPMVYSAPNYSQNRPQQLNYQQPGNYGPQYSHAGPSQPHPTTSQAPQNMYSGQNMYSVPPQNYGNAYQPQQEQAGYNSGQQQQNTQQKVQATISARAQKAQYSAPAQIKDELDDDAAEALNAIDTTATDLQGTYFLFFTFFSFLSFSPMGHI